MEFKTFAPSTSLWSAHKYWLRKHALWDVFYRAMMFRKNRNLAEKFAGVKNG